MPSLPGVNHLDAVRALEKAGWWVLRQGKHIIMTNGAHKVVIPRHNPVNAHTMGASSAALAFPTTSSANSFDR